MKNQHRGSLGVAVFALFAASTAGQPSSLPNDPCYNIVQIDYFWPPQVGAACVQGCSPSFDVAVSGSNYAVVTLSNPFTVTCASGGTMQKDINDNWYCDLDHLQKVITRYHMSGSGSCGCSVCGD